MPLAIPTPFMDSSWDHTLIFSVNQPAVVTGGFPSYHWIYWIGPILGGLLAAVFYKTVKALKFDLVTTDTDVPTPRGSVAQSAPNNGSQV